VTAVGVGLDSAHLVRTYGEEHDLRFPIATLEDLRYAALFRATRVPVTLVVGEPGRVLYGRTGALSSEEALDSVLSALGSNPPGIAAEAANVQEGPATTPASPAWSDGN